jgi:acetyl-CoA C-acetyltransferase
MHMTKHAFGLYSTTPGEISDARSTGFSSETAPIVDRYEGMASVAAYTVAHARSGEPEWGLVIADVDGGRAYGRVEDPELLADLEAREWVGESVSFVPGEAEGVNLVKV